VIQRSSASALNGAGSPKLEKMVDSSATTALPAARADRTSDEMTGVITHTVCRDR
jgi:hypothetical protein